jgi:bacteriocin biosynthesis cyclodehydratase domain-containing protein
MIYQLDPHIHRVWRSPDVVQFGVERPVLTLRGLSNAEERLLVALDAGVTLSGLQLVARRAGGDADVVRRMLHRLTPVLLDPAGRSRTAAASATAEPIVVLDGAGRSAARAAQVLRESGVDVRSGLAADDPVIDAAQVAIVIASFAVHPERYRRWMQRDTPHLAVVFGDRSVTVGPFVEPGDGPCLGCGHRRQVESDPDWAAMAGQLFSRDAGRESSVVGSTVAAMIARAVLDRVQRDSRPLRATSVSVVYETGFTSVRTHRPHEECGCRALPGTGTADASTGVRPPSLLATSSSAAGDVPA